MANEGDGFFNALLDLFDRRMAIYDTFVNAGAAILYETAKEGEDPRMEIDKAMNRAQFLFGEEMVAHLRQFHAAATHLSNLHFQFQFAKTEEKREALEEEMTKASAQLDAAFETFDPPFMPYLALTQKSNEFWPSNSLTKARRLLGR